MNRIFCTSCGNKMEFDRVKPNFCFKCGDSLNAFAKRKVQEFTEEEEYSDEEEEEFTPPRRDIRLQVEMENSSFTIADAIKNPVAPSEKMGKNVKRGSGRKALNNLRDLFKKVGSDEE